MKQAFINIQVERADKKKLQAIARGKHLNLSTLMRIILIDYLSKSDTSEKAA
jgi:hypothetical protein